MNDIFLSASIPLPDRDKENFTGTDVLAIREALKALIEIVLPDGSLTFGGHPAITPLVSIYSREMKIDPTRITVFQSRYYEGRFPATIDQFVNVRHTTALKTERASLKLMRKEMISSKNFDAAVLIGGMDGVSEEYRLFSEIHPQKRIIPIATTGAAARHIFAQGKFDPAWKDELNYTTLFRRVFRPDWGRRPKEIDHSH
jgi:hypothetical protein